MKCMDSSDCCLYLDQALNHVLKSVQRFNPRQKKDFFSETDTTYFPADGLTASIICSFFLRLDPWDCFPTSTCHLRQSLLFLSKAASLDNSFRHHKFYPPASSQRISPYSKPFLQRCSRWLPRSIPQTPHDLTPLVSPSGILQFNPFAKLLIRIWPDTVCNLHSPDPPTTVQADQRSFL